MAVYEMLNAERPVA